jgi:hypothetical protein
LLALQLLGLGWIILALGKHRLALRLGRGWWRVLRVGQVLRIGRIRLQGLQGL